MVDLAAAHAAYIQDGDLDALLASIRTYALRRSKDDDVAQATAITIWRKLDQYDPGRGSFAAWVSVITRNAITDAKRRDGKLVPTEDALLEAPSLEPGCSPSRLREVVADDTCPELVELLLAGHTISSAAKRLGLTYAQAMSRLKIIKKKLAAASKSSSLERITY